ncbi:MAG: alpha-L-fucosidase [Prevotella sp.]|nr:alpha-L-fucosidase [Prevotella sp.]
MKNCLSIALMLFVAIVSQAQSASDLPALSPMPEVDAPKAIGSVPLGDINTFREIQLDIPITEGPFKPSWESIEANFPGTPEWLREAKFGIWVHFGPQAAGESGDWYARNLYKEDHQAYKNHLQRYGHPSEVGYKEVLHQWKPDKLDPDRLTALYQKAGARFLLVQGVHHDNYDLWNSQYQPWNSVNVGPKRDLLREWADACHKYGMRYGVTFHHEYTWWWWQTAFGADKKGDRAGVPYDGHLTKADGKGKWWEGLDPRLLYGIDLREYEDVDAKAHTGWSPPKDGIIWNHLDYARWFATQWALRMMDVTHNYDPDFIYTDGTKEGPFCGTGTGTLYKCNAMPLVMADFYNHTLKQRGEVNTFSIVKFRHPTNGTVNTAEFGWPDSINTAQPWMREGAVGDWFYAPGFVYDAGSVIRYIIESISRDGCAAINIPMKPDGSIEPACEQMLEEVGRWMETCGEAVYGSRAWTTYGEGPLDNNGHLRKLPGHALKQQHADFPFTPQDLRFTVGKSGDLYAFCMRSPEAGQKVTIKSMGKQQVKKIRRVTMLGHNGKLKWKQTTDGMEITTPTTIPFTTATVFKIEL